MLTLWANSTTCYAAITSSTQSPSTAVLIGHGSVCDPEAPRDGLLSMNAEEKRILAFVESALVPTTRPYLQATELYDLYVDWMVLRELGFASQKRFGLAIRRAGITKTRSRPSGRKPGPFWYRLRPLLS